MRGTVLVVDDRARPRRALATKLEDAGFPVVQASQGVEAWERFCQHAPDVVISDMVMPHSDGLDLLSRIRSRSDVPVILFTARGTAQSAATAFKAGADAFLSSVDVHVDDLVALVEDAIAGARPSQDFPSLEEGLVGKSRAMSRLRERISGIEQFSPETREWAGEPAYAIRGLARHDDGVLFHDLEIDAPIDDRVFSPTTLDQQRQLPVQEASGQPNGPVEQAGPRSRHRDPHP